jgi:CTP:molybdopterin cytidylyltransferase MocA
MSIYHMQPTVASVTLAAGYSLRQSKPKLMHDV